MTIFPTKSRIFHTVINKKSEKKTKMKKIFLKFIFFFLCFSDLCFPEVFHDKFSKRMFDVMLNVKNNI